MRYLKTIIIDVKFLHDFFIYPYSLFRYILRRKKSKKNSIEIGKHWQNAFKDSNATNWRGERGIH